jgi:hypothetical protein
LQEYFSEVYKGNVRLNLTYYIIAKSEYRYIDWHLANTRTLGVLYPFIKTYYDVRRRLML